MKYQLVIQFQATSTDDFDRLIAFEQSLTTGLEGFAPVDGHDSGSGEFNIFVLTDDPMVTFGKVQEVTMKQPPHNRMRIAYRDLDGEDFTILWPPNLKEFNVA